MTDNVNAKTTYRNDPVSVQVDEGEKFTVPDDELWKVDILWMTDENSFGDHGNITINGVGMNSRLSNNSQTVGYVHMRDVVLEGGDTIEPGLDGRGGAAWITGWVIN